MSTITVTNNTKLPIHIATQWNHIVQEYHNDVQPGDSVNLASANFGWQDFIAVTGTPENKISHKDDWLSVLGLGAAALGTLGTIAGIVLIPISGGTSAVIAAGSAAAGASAISALGGAAVMIGDFVINPATVSGLWGPDGYTMNVDGGDITAVQTDEGVKITNVSPINVHWRNKVSGTSGTSTSKK